MDGVRVKNLEVERGGISILAGVSFDLAPGSALILRGPNGVGKTSLLRTLAGLQPPCSGKMDIDADNVIYAAHADGVKATLSVAVNLTFWARVFGQSDISKALAEFDLHDLLERPAGSLSAGQKRRLGLARLAVSGRKVWLLDEPTVSLDTRAIGLFASALKTHLDDGGCAIIATHIDLGFSAETFDLSACRDQARVLLERQETFL